MLPPDDTPVNRLADGLLLIRLARDVTQEALAKELGRGRSTVSSWETGGSAPPAADVKRYMQMLEELRAADPETADVGRLTASQLYTLWEEAVRWHRRGSRPLDPLPADEDLGQSQDAAAVRGSIRRDDVGDSDRAVSNTAGSPDASAPDDMSSVQASTPLHTPRNDEPRAARRAKPLQVLFGIGALIVLAVALVLVLDGDDTSAPDRGRAEPPRAQHITAGQSNGRPHVLFLIDLSESMRANPLNRRVPNEGTRIDNGLDFVSRGIEFGESFERVGVWLVTSSRQVVPDDCAWVPEPPRTPRLYCVMHPLGEASERTRADLAARVRDLHANGGGNALYRAMADAVRAVRRDWIASGRDPRVTPSVVVITDGLNNRRVVRRSLSSLAAEAGDEVQVLITAFDKKLCDAELANTVKRYFRWYECFPVASHPDAVRARERIARLLITPASRSK